MTSTATPIDARGCQRTLHGPSWRKQLGLSLCRKSTRSTQRSGPTGSPRRPEDAALRAYCDYLQQAARQGMAAARAKFPLVAQAEDLEQDPARREAAMIMVMGDIAAEEMGKRLAIPRPTIELWEALNLDVRDLRRAVAWIAVEVIRPEQKAGRTQLAARLKLALVAGPEAARALVSCGESGLVDEADRLFQRDLKLAAKFEEAADLPLHSGPETVAVLNLRIEQMRLGLAKAELAEKCAKVRERHELKVLRVKLQAKLAADRQAAGGRRRGAAAVEARKPSVNWRGSGLGRTSSLVRLGPPSRRWPNCSGCPRRKAKRPAPSRRQFSGPRRTTVRRTNPGGRQFSHSPARGRRPTGPALSGRWRMTAAMRSKSSCQPTSVATSRRPPRQASWP